MAEIGSNSKWNGLTIALAGGLAVLLGISVYTISELGGKQDQIDSLTAKLAANQEEFAAEIQRLETMDEHAAENAREQSKTLTAVDEQSKRNAQGVRNLRESAEETGETVSQLTQSQQQEAQRALQAEQELTQQVAVLEESAEAADSGIEEVAGELAGLRAEAATKAELAATGERVSAIGGQVDSAQTILSRQQEELAALRQRADRDYLDFQIFRLNEPIVMGDATVTLLSVDDEDQNVDLTLEVEGRTMRRPNTFVNEPVFFLVGDNRTLYELVISAVDGNQAEGYLARPPSDTGAEDAGEPE